MPADSRAFWITAAGRGEIRSESLLSPSASDVVVRALYSGVSRGTESLVFNGRVPASEYQRMRAPFQAGEFPSPVKYGYASVGRVESGPGEFRDRNQYPIPCLVILDLKMPKKNGLEVLQWLRTREDFKDLPVVMVTSSDEHGDRTEALKQGVEAFRVKPVSFKELLQLAGEIKEEADDHCKDAAPCPKEAGP